MLGSKLEYGYRRELSLDGEEVLDSITDSSNFARTAFAFFVDLPSLKGQRKARTKPSFTHPTKNGKQRMCAFLLAPEEKKIREVILKRYPQHLPAFDLSIHTGMRAGEQFDLKWSQVSFERNYSS